MDGVGAYLLLEFLCFCFIFILFPSLFKQQKNTTQKNRTNIEFTIGLFVLVFLILLFFLPELIEEIIWRDFDMMGP